MEVNPAIQSYVVEARDLLTQLETMLLDLEQEATPEAVDSVFRALHTLKGGGGCSASPRFPPSSTISKTPSTWSAWARSR